MPKKADDVRTINKSTPVVYIAQTEIKNVKRVDWEIVYNPGEDSKVVGRIVVGIDDYDSRLTDIFKEQKDGKELMMMVKYMDKVGHLATEGFGIMKLEKITSEMDTNHINKEHVYHFTASSYWLTAVE